MIANVQHWTELIAKKFSGNIRADEARMLDEWVARDAEHQDYYEHLVHVWDVSTMAVTDTEITEADWVGLEKQIEAPSGRLHLPRITLPNLEIPRIPIGRLAAAAAFLVLIVSGIAIVSYVQNSNTSQMIVAEAGDRGVFEVILPDGTTVTLRKGSSLQYDQDFVTRDVSLTGEAFFAVKRDEARPFSVTAGSGTIRVLGTRFSVKAAESSPVELFVEEGRVAFSPTDRKYDAKIFSAGQAGELGTSDEAEVERTAAPGQNITSWISGRLVFDHAPLDHVITDISRHFLVEMSADATLNACELKADFTNATLDNVLETLSFSLNLQIEKTGDKYVISGEPCATETEN